ncbi:MAG TPA: BamA/TamA family outer membrane protein, partial [Longimicrobiales bacterium]|nr:BamA/TamA family outer membrane protein [Longimicrobiales bacterium]
MPRGVVRLLLACLALGGLSAPSPVTAQTDRPEVLRLTFEGNRAFPDDSLRRAIVNRATDCRSLVFQPLCWLGAQTFFDQQYLVPRQLPLDALRLERYYAERGYRAAEVDTALVQLDGGVGVRFDIEEGEPILIDSLGFVGLEQTPLDGRASLVEDLPVDVGDPANAIRIDRARDVIITRLRNRGYAHAEVLIDQFIPAGSREATVEFVFDTGPLVRIGEVTVDGNRILDETAIRRMVPFEQGDLYRRRELEAGQRNLYSLDLVRTANVREEGEELDTVMPVAIEVREGDLHRVRTAVGWSTSDCVNLEARWASRNFFGGARRLEVSARVSNILAQQLNQNFCPQTGSGDFADLNGQVEVGLVQPWIFSPRNSLSASAFIERQSLPDVFIREALGVNVSLSRILGTGATATLSYTPQITRLDAAEIFFCSSFRVCTQDDIDLFRASNWLAPLGLTFSLERVNQLLNPTRGYQATLGLETASSLTASDFAYRRATGAVVGYTELGGGAVVALRAAGGIVSEGEFFRLVEAEDRVGIIHPEKRLYSGGASSVRGYAENRLGPQVLSVRTERLLQPIDGGAPACTAQEVFLGTCDAGPVPLDRFTARPTGGDRLLEANLEVRIPFGGNRFQFVSFVDAGQVWGRNESIGWSDVAVTPGVGVRYFSPVGPIRIDLGLRPDRDRAVKVISG